MSGICSAHMGYHQLGCEQCAARVEDLLPGYEEKRREAEEAGLHACPCGFEHYRTVSFCPRCHRNLPGVCPEHERYEHSCLACRRGVYER